MKRVLCMILSLTMVFSLVACGSKTETPEETPEAPAGETYEFKLGISTIIGSVRGEMANAFKAYVEEASEGRMTVEIFDNGALGNEQEMAEMVKTGSLDFTIPGVSALSNMDGNFGAYGLPFLVGTYDEAHALLDGDFGDALKDIAVTNGYKIMGWGDLGRVQITNNKRPIKSVEDMAGINMRCTNEEVSLKTMAALGCATTTLAFSELYLGLSNGVVDGQFNPIDAIYQNSFTEVQDYLAIVNMYTYGLAFLMGNDKFEAMSAEDQQILLDGALKAQEAGRAYCANAEGEYLQKCKDEGCFVEITEPDVEGFKAATASIYDEYLATCDPRIVEAVNAVR